MREEVILDVKTAFLRDARGTESEKARTWAIISQRVRQAMYTRTAPMATMREMEEKVDIAAAVAGGTTGTGNGNPDGLLGGPRDARVDASPAAIPNNTRHDTDVEIGEFSDEEDDGGTGSAAHLRADAEEQAKEPDLCSDDDDEHDTDADRMLSDPTLPWDHAACQADKLERESQSWTVSASGCLLETADHTKSMPIGYANSHPCRARVRVRGMHSRPH